MGNCLVTKLKEVVNNDSLLKLGVVKLKVNAFDGTPASGYQYELTIKTNGEPVTISVPNGAYFTVGSSTLNDPSTRKTTYTWANTSLTGFYFKYDSTYDIEITNKYAIVELYTHPLYAQHKIISPYIDTLAYCTNLKRLDFEYTDISGDISALSTLSSIEQLYFMNTPLAGDISTFAPLSTLKTLRLSLNMTGNISSFSNLVNLNELVLNTKVVGDISSFSNLVNIEYINADYSIVTGDIAVFNNAVNITQLLFLNSKVSGNIQSLDALTNANEINMYNNIVGGSLDSFVSGQVANGRTSVSATNAIYMPRVIQYASFGNAEPGDINEYHCHVIWVSASQIAVYAGGETIETSPRVYCKGYGTQEQAESAFSGKTVTRVDA